MFHAWEIPGFVTVNYRPLKRVVSSRRFYEKAIKNTQGREITKAILKLLSEYGALNVHKIRDIVKLGPYDRICARVNYLKKRGMLKIVDYGKYDLV